MSLSLLSKRMRRPLPLSPAVFCPWPRGTSPRVSAHIVVANVCTPKRGVATQTACQTLGALRDVLQVSREVSEAVASNKPVVALESTIYTHGAMGDVLVREHVDLVRSWGGIPAIIAILDGRPKVGVSPDEVVRMSRDAATVKVSRRDISYLVGMVSSLLDALAPSSLRFRRPGCG